MRNNKVVLIPSSSVVHISNCADVLVISSQALARLLALEAKLTAVNVDSLAWKSDQTKAEQEEIARDIEKASHEFCEMVAGLGLTSDWIADVLTPEIDKLEVY